MTGAEAVALVAREAAAAGVEFGPAGRDPATMGRIARRLDDCPVLVAPFVASARREIEERRGHDGR